MHKNRLSSEMETVLTYTSDKTVPKEKNDAWHWEGNCPPFFFYIITKYYPLLLYIGKCFVLLLHKGLRLILHTNLIR